MQEDILRGLPRISRQREAEIICHTISHQAFITVSVFLGLCENASVKQKEGIALCREETIWRRILRGEVRTLLLLRQSGVAEPGKGIPLSARPPDNGIYSFSSGTTGCIFLYRDR